MARDDIKLNGCEPSCLDTFKKANSFCCTVLVRIERDIYYTALLFLATIAFKNCIA